MLQNKGQTLYRGNRWKGKRLNSGRSPATNGQCCIPNVAHCSGHDPHCSKQVHDCQLPLLRVDHVVRDRRLGPKALRHKQIKGGILCTADK
eukprot:1148937-Pelagomonas_calceolata.AAC.8